LAEVCTLPIISFANFLLRCLVRAAIDSAEFFELKMRTTIIALTLIGLGFALHWAVRGIAETKNEAYKWAVLVAAPTVLFLAGLFLVNAFRAPYLIYAEEHGKMQQAIGDADTKRMAAEAKVKELEAKLTAQAPTRTAQSIAREKRRDSLARLINRGVP
jgi:hypothetical protein